MQDFQIVYKDGDLFCDHLKCRHCDEKVSRGIVSVSSHWMNCMKRTEGLIQVKTI